MKSILRFDYVGRVSVVCTLFSGLLITNGATIQLLALGEDMKNRSLFPLIFAAREIAFLVFF